MAERMTDLLGYLEFVEHLCDEHFQHEGTKCCGCEPVLIETEVEGKPSIKLKCAHCNHDTGWFPKGEYDEMFAFWNLMLMEPGHRMILHEIVSLRVELELKLIP